MLKLEHLQHGGSFKARGAFANLLLRDIPAAGVVAASGGNHGVAVALAANRLGIPAKIFVPAIASPAKIQKIRESGADLVVAGDRYADALAASIEWAGTTGALPCTPSTSARRCLAKAPSRWNCQNRRLTWTPCSSPSAVAASSAASPRGFSDA